MVAMSWHETEHIRALLSGQLDEEEAQRTLSAIGFADGRSAARCLRRLASESEALPYLSQVMAYLLASFAGMSRLDRMLVNVERFVHSFGDQAGAFRYLAKNPRALEILLKLFAGSQFLTEILLRHPEYLPLLAEAKYLTQAKSAEQLHAEAKAVSSERPSLDEQLLALRIFQRRELLRIGSADLLNLADLPMVAQQLSDLAEALIRVCLDIAAVQAKRSPEGFAVIGLGKLGGRELNYSSDIDLLFIAESNASNYKRLGEFLLDSLARVTAEGFLYRVDMRLRPWGRVGPLVTSLSGYMSYLVESARLWEKQALLKARFIAGDPKVGAKLLDEIQPLLFGSVAEAVRSEVYSMKQRTEAYLRQQGRDWGDLKLGEGSIRDIEFVAQYLQLVHGVEQPRVRSQNTLEALRRLALYRFISPDEYRVLADGYIVFRTIEHYLQMMEYQQTHALPKDSQDLAQLAHRLGFLGPEAGARLLARYEEHRAAIRAVYLKHLGGSEMSDSERGLPPPTQPDVIQHVARMDPSYTEVFTAEQIKHHAALAERLSAENLVEVEALPQENGLWQVTIVAYDYPGELSLICGLLSVYGFSIQDGNVFTYEPLDAQPSTPAEKDHPSTVARAQAEMRRKIVDVFTVRPERVKVTEDTWARYAEELAGLLRLMHHGQRAEAHGQLARRFATALQEAGNASHILYPVEIEIDNSLSERYTVLRIDAPDTIGFLYELTNALALSRIYISRVLVDSVGNRVRDILYVTDAEGRKITTPQGQRQLRAATVLIKHFTHLLPHSPNPESALLHFREFLAQLFQRENWPDDLASLERPEVLGALARVLGVSDFLWDDFLRMQYTNLFPVVQDVNGLAAAKSREQLQAELEAVLRPVHDGPQPPREDAPWREALNAFKDREMFRIDMRHILGHTAEFWDFSRELTDLVEVVVNAAYHLCHEDLRSVYGTPRLENGEVSEMAVCALGKCGGRELGFASDIELMFVYAGNGKTTGPQVISSAEFYERLVETFVSAIRARREGIFEIDLQLRPYGKAGSLAVSLEAFSRYFAPDGPAWPYERQALVKLRAIAGNEGLGRYIEELRDRFVYTGEAFDVAAMRAMRERQIRHLVTGGTFNAKYSPGGLVDVEYLVQALQIMHGHRNPKLRLTNTREAMAALAEAGILSAEDYVRLRKAHTFLRWLIDALRMVRGNAKDLTVPPADSEEFAYLARRLRYGRDVARLREELMQYTTSVQELSARLLG